MAWKNLSLRSKLLTIGITLSVIPLLLIALLNYSQSNQLKDVAQKESMKLAETDLENIAKSVYTLCDISKNTLEHSVVSHFNVAQDIFTRKGEVTFSQDKITWDAKNQFTLASQRIEVPKMLVGGEWLGQTTEFHKEVPLVDTVLNLTSSHCTVFQRINEAGDMLRIATTVAGKDGNRAIGTYIPAFDADGNPNPVVSSILRGQKYTGRAFVVKEWLMTTYAPIYDNRKRIAGMLFVGLKDNMAAMVEKAITSIDVGTTGYVYVLDSKGYYVISQKSKRNGEWIWESKDSDGKYFVQDIIKIALSLNKGEIGNLRYPWKNQEDPVARYKHAKIMYFAPWDWVIGAGSYEEEFLAAVNKITVISNTGNTIFFVLFLVTLFITVFVWWLVSKIITNPIVHVITELSESADQVSSASSQMSKSAQEISEGASEQASTLEEVSSSMEELSAMTKQNADNAASSEKLSKVSKKNAEQGNESMKSLGEAMYMVDASAQEMGKIIKNIEEIAFQTNMLALNAAVEAARAGEHGRGFAVVAEEVRNLARKAGDFAKSTAALVVETMDQIKNGTEVSKKTMQMFDEIVKDANQVNELASEVSAATQEQARGLNQVTISITDMDKVVQSNAANAEESSSIGEELNAQAVGLQSMVERLMEIIGMSHNHNSSEKNERFQKTVNPRGMGNRATARPTFQKSLPNKKSLQQAKLPVKPEDVIPLEKDEFKDF